MIVSRTKRHAMKRQRGIMITDAVIGIGLLGTLMVVIAITAGHDLRAKRAAAEHRELTFAAEAALVDLRTGWRGRTVEADDKPEIKITILSDEAAPAGQVWVRIVSRDGRQSVVLQGLVPKQASTLEAGS